MGAFARGVRKRESDSYPVHLWSVRSRRVRRAYLRLRRRQSHRSLALNVEWERNASSIIEENTGPLLIDTCGPNGLSMKNDRC